MEINLVFTKIFNYINIVIKKSNNVRTKNKKLTYENMYFYWYYFIVIYLFTLCKYLK